MSTDLEKFKRFDAKLEWPARILFTIAIIYATLKMNSVEEPSSYVDGVCLLTVLALWCYFLKVRILSIGILLMLIFLAWAHPPH